MFRLEQDLVDVLRRGVLAALPLRRRPQFRWIATEVQVAMTIPDVMVFSSFASADPRPPQLTLFDSSVVAEVIRHPGITEAAVARRLYARPETISTSIARLEKFGIVARQDRGHLHCRKRAVPVGHIEVIAIEAKLCRWRQAIQQAVSYLEFANVSYVALPESTVEDAVVHECEISGVGLMSVGRRRAIQVLVAPCRRTPLSPSSIWLALRALAQAGGSKGRWAD